MSLLLVGCTPPVRAPYDASKVPNGTGWYCYLSGTSSAEELSLCYRAEGECFADRQQRGGERCEPATAAFCFQLGDKTTCYGRQTDCESMSANANASQAGMVSKTIVSECGAQS